MKLGRKMVGIYSTCIILVLTLLVGMPFWAIAADTIKIGDLEPLSGPSERWGKLFSAGLQFAVDEQNAKGGLFGKKIEIITEDSELKPDVAVRKAKKLIMEDKINILASGFGSAISLACNKVASDYKTLYINFGSMSDQAQGGEFFSRYGFRVIQNAHSLHTASALLMVGKPYKRFYIMAQDYVFSYDAAKVFKEQLKILVPNAQIVGEDYAPIGTKDFAPYITKIIAAKADFVFSPATPPDITNFIRQARAMGLKAPFPFLTQIVEIAVELKDDAAGVYYVDQYSLRTNTPENQELIKRYHERYKNDKDFWLWWPVGSIGRGLIGWKMAFAALEKIGSIDPEKVIEGFEGFQWKSPVGLYTMRKCDHQTMLPVYGGIIEAGNNPWYNGSIRADVNFPYEGPKIQMFPADKVSIPATPAYNPRCK
jgi:branched-chain amino acid transport system substrate-binding protein